MSVIILFIIIITVAFLVAFVSSRRFGPMVLGLAAGALLSEWWAGWLAQQLTHYGISQTIIPNGVLAAVIILLAPLVLLLLGGPKYHGKYERIVSAIAIAVMVAALLVKPLGGHISLEGQSLAVYTWLSQQWKIIATVGIILGVMDLFLLHTGRKIHSPKTHK